MSQPPSLVEAALVGTARQAAAPLLPEPLQQLAASLPEELDDGRRLLLVAGLDAIYRAAGRVAEPLVVAAPPADLRPEPAPPLAQLLEEILAFGHRPLLVQALDELDRAGRRWPARLLPALLEQGRGFFRGRAALLARLLDHRGRWLAAQRSEWSWALLVNPEEGKLQAGSWQEGELAARILAFRHFREREREAARSELAAAFKQEKAEARAALLGCLAAGLGAADESFLESCLGDRSQLVREGAKELLLRLPASAWAGRCRERATGWLRRAAPAGGGLLAGFKKIFGGGPPQLVVELPEQPDAGWERDGLVAKAPAGIGPKAFWLSQVVATVPPRFWCETWQLEPAELIASCASHEHFEALLLGLGRAAAALGDRELAGRLLPLLGQPPGPVGAYFQEKVRELCPALFLALAPEERLRLATSWLEQGVPPGIEIREGLLPPSFEPAAADVFLASLERAIGNFSRGNDWQAPFLQFLPLAATALPVAAASRPLPQLREDHRGTYSYEPLRQQYCAILNLRQRLAQEIPL